MPLVIASNPENDRYLATKRERMGHLFDYDADAPAAPGSQAEAEADAAEEAAGGA